MGALVAVLVLSGIHPNAMFVVYASGTPDAYGNKIYSVETYQEYPNATQYNYHSMTNDTYFASAIQVALDPGNAVNIYITVYFNSSLADNYAQAMTYIRVNMTINNAVWTNQSMVDGEIPIAYLGEDVWEGTTYWMFKMMRQWYTPDVVSGTVYTATLYYNVWR